MKPHLQIIKIRKSLNILQEQEVFSPGRCRSSLSITGLGRSSKVYNSRFKTEKYSVQFVDENAMPPLPFRNEKPENLPTLIITENKFRSK